MENMKMTYDNTNRGSIWINRDKEKETLPDINMEVNFFGNDYKIALWKKKPDAKAGAPDYSFKIEDKPVKQERAERENQVTYEQDDFDQQIPF